MSTLILWIRHAESCSNAVEKMSPALGKTREPVLSPKGVLEAYYMGKCLVDFFLIDGILTRFHITNFNFYCSFLVRTMITMKLISECFKKKLNHQSIPIINRLCFISEKLNKVEEAGLSQSAIYHGTQNISTHLKTKAHEYYLNNHHSINNIGYPINTEIIGPCCDFFPDRDTLCYSQPNDYNNFLHLSRRLEEHFQPNHLNLIVSHGKYIHDNVHLHLLDSALSFLNEGLYGIFREVNGNLSSCTDFFEKLDLFFPQTQYTIDDFFIKLCEDVILVQSTPTPDNIKTSPLDIINAVKFRLSYNSPHKHPEHHGIYNTEGLLCEYLPSGNVKLKVIFEPGDLSNTPPAAGGAESIYRKYIVVGDTANIREPSYTEDINRSYPIYNCVNPTQGYEVTAKTFGFEPKFIFQRPDSPGITFTQFLDYFDENIDLGNVYKQPIELYKKTKTAKDILVASGTVATGVLSAGLGTTVAAGSAAAAGAAGYLGSFFR